MAREIVITSVPRGVKLGRTGFQVAMRTAGLRDDVSASLERMAGYRHVAAGHGMNPVCYFHRRDRTTGAGPIHVVGRIVDAGVDFSNRSNKLAHMVILEPADLAQVAASSPAGLLAAIEERLANRWTDGPEERQSPFNLAGIPASNPAPCTAWQQAMGDAGWAGVIAERALANLPTLLIGPDHSPASCRRMLTLFEEALTIVPPPKRWEITFDTTTLDPNGILWRGTYAGSPESQALQPGLLVVDLRRPQPIPADLAAGPLVNAARTGAGPVFASRGPVNPSGVPSVGGQTGGGDVFAGIDGSGARGVTVLPPPPPEREDDRGEIPLPGKKASRWLITILAITATAAVLLLLAGIVVSAFVLKQRWNTQIAALQRIKDYADNKEGATVPTKDDVVTARGAVWKDDLSNAVAKPEYLKFLNAVLESKEVTALQLADTTALKKMLDAVADVMTKPANESRGSWPTVLGRALSPRESNLLVAFHAGAFPTYGEFRDLADGFKRLEDLTADSAKKDPDAVMEKLWTLLTEQAQADGVERDYGDAKALFVSRVRSDDLADKDRLLDVVRKCARIAPSPPSNVDMTGDGETKETKDADAHGSGKTHPPPPEPPDPVKVFEELKAAISKFCKDKKSVVLPQPGAKAELFSVSPEVAKNLDVDVVVGTLHDFPVTVTGTGDDQRKSWHIMLTGTCLMTITLEKTGTIALQRGVVNDHVWRSQEQYLRFMPIGFRRQNQPLDTGDIVVLSQPEEVVLQSGSNETLETLLCGDQGSVPLPSNSPCGATVTWKPRSEQFDAQKFTVSVTQLVAGGKDYQLKFTVPVDGKDFTLTEDITLEDTVRRKHKSWTDPSSIGKLFDTYGLMRLGLKKKDGFVSFVDIQEEEKWIPAIIKKIMDAHEFEGITVDRVRNDVLSKWVDYDANKKLSYNKLASLLQWGEVLRDYIKKSEFGKKKEGQFVDLNRQKPRVEYVAPEIKQGETDADFKKRQEAAAAKHAAEVAVWNQNYDEFMSSATRDAAILREYLESRKPPPDAPKAPIDAELAAICVLLEIDGLIITKAYREELDALLPRTPIAALFEGEATYEWTVETDGEKTVLKVPVARLLPADLLPVKADEPGRAP